VLCDGGWASRSASFFSGFEIEKQYIYSQIVLCGILNPDGIILLFLVHYLSVLIKYDQDFSPEFTFSDFHKPADQADLHIWN
jgi:hypothetical protein